jgi:hypothetical protein
MFKSNDWGIANTLRKNLFCSRESLEANILFSIYELWNTKSKDI